MRRLSMAVSIALLICGCNGSTEPFRIPATPSAIPPSSPPPTVLRGGALSGVVYEVTAAGDVPLEGVHVYWSEYRGTDTDRQGAYSIPDVHNGIQPVWVAKDGYKFAVDIPHPAGEPWRDVLVDGDTRFDIKLVRR